MRGRLLLAAILVAGLVVRLVGLGWGLPYTDLHPDEPLMAQRADHVHWAHLNPHFYIYPSFAIYQQALVRGAARLAGAGQAGALYGARLMTALYDGLAVLVLYLLGARLAGRRAALVAAGLYALFAPAVLHAHYAVTDTPMTALATVALWLSVAGWQRRSWPWLAGAAVAAGLAVSTKYSAAPVLYVPLVACFAVAAARRWAPGRTAMAALAVPALGVAAFLAASPYVVLDHQTFFRDLRVEQELQATARSGEHEPEATELGLGDRGLVANGPVIFDDLGPPAALLALLGLGAAVAGFFRRDFESPAERRDAARHADATQPPPGLDPAPIAGETGGQEPSSARGGDPVGTTEDETAAGQARDARPWDVLGWAIVAPWPILYYLLMAPSAIPGQRYMLPIYPALCLLAAGGLVLVARRLPGAWVAPALAAAVVALPALDTARVVSVLATRDTRLVARDWVLDNIPPGTRIGREQYAPPLHTSDGYRVMQMFSLTEQSFDVFCSEGVRYLLLSSKNAERFFADDTDRYLDQRNWYRDLEARARRVETFPGAELSYHDPTIEVWQVYCPGR